MTDAQKLAEWMAELSTCVYNRLKKGKITMGLNEMWNENDESLEEPSKWPEYFDNDVTIDDAEKIFKTHFKEMSGYRFVFLFDDDEIKNIFDGDVEIQYSEDNTEQFVPTVYLGMIPKRKKVPIQNERKRPDPDVKLSSHYEKILLKHKHNALVIAANEIVERNKNGLGPLSTLYQSTWKISDEDKDFLRHYPYEVNSMTSFMQDVLDRVKNVKVKTYAN